MKSRQFSLKSDTFLGNTFNFSTWQRCRGGNFITAPKYATPRIRATKTNPSWTLRQTEQTHKPKPRESFHYKKKKNVASMHGLWLSELRGLQHESFRRVNMDQKWQMVSRKVSSFQQNQQRRVMRSRAEPRLPVPPRCRSFPSSTDNGNGNRL